MTFVLTLFIIMEMSKYDSVRKTKRDLLLCEQHVRYPDLSYKELGMIFGVTKQRIHQILKRNNKKRDDNDEYPDKTNRSSGINRG